jgi:hypothetical protein
MFRDGVAAVTLAAVLAGCVLFWDRLGWDRATSGDRHCTPGSTLRLQVNPNSVLCRASHLTAIHALTQARKPSRSSSPAASRRKTDACSSKEAPIV